MKHNFTKWYFYPCVIALFLLADTARAQMIPLPAQSSVYTGYVRGFWFISPVGFTITGLRVPASAGTGTQSIQVMKIHSGGVALYPTMGTNFTNLYYVNGAANNVIQTVNIPVAAGDTIGILGQAGTSTSYSPSAAPFSATIGGQPTSLNRFLYQGPINVTQAHEYSSESGFNIGRIEVYYMVAPPDNAGIDSLVNPPVSGMFCSGMQDVKVRLRNLGSNTLDSVDINWSLDGVNQSPVHYTVPVDSISSPNNMAIVTLGTAYFPFNAPVAIKAWTSMPNGVADNDNTDDTLTETVTSAIEGVTVNIVPGDTMLCEGHPLVLDAGVQPPGAIYIWNTGELSQTISVTNGDDYSVRVQSATGCIDEDTVHITEVPPPVASSIAIVDNGSGNFTFNLIGAQHIDTYVWDFGDGTGDSGAGSKTHQYTQTGLYAVTVTLSNSCGEILLTKELQVISLGISDLNIQKAIRLFPNPAQNKVSLSIQGGLRMNHVSVYNALGQQVFSSDAAGADLEINTAAFAGGLYQVVVDVEQGQVVKKLSIIR